MALAARGPAVVPMDVALSSLSLFGQPASKRPVRLSSYALLSDAMGPTRTTTRSNASRYVSLHLLGAHATFYSKPSGAEITVVCGRQTRL